LGSRNSDRADGAGLAAGRPLRKTASHGLKIVVVGGFGVGKTTFPPAGGPSSFPGSASVPDYSSSAEETVL
jgi:hypothetical protein